MKVEARPQGIEVGVSPHEADIPKAGGDGPAQGQNGLFPEAAGLAAVVSPEPGSAAMPESNDRKQARL